MFNFVPSNFDSGRFRLNGPIQMDLLSPTMQSACAAELRDFVQNQAAELAGDVGFGWTPVAETRVSCPELHRLVGRSAGTKEPLPVPALGAERTILLSVTATLALRYWRAMCKVRLTERCDAASELDCDLRMVAIAEREEVSPVAMLYLEAELVGSSLLTVCGYAPPVDAQTYTLDVLMLGYADAIIIEAERQTMADPSSNHDHYQPSRS